MPNYSITPTLLLLFASSRSDASTGYCGCELHGLASGPPQPFDSCSGGANGITGCKIKLEAAVEVRCVDGLALANRRGARHVWQPAFAWRQLHQNRLKHTCQHSFQWCTRCKRERLARSCPFLLQRGEKADQLPAGRPTTADNARRRNDSEQRIATDNDLTVDVGVLR